MPTPFLNLSTLFEIRKEISKTLDVVRKLFTGVTQSLRVGKWVHFPSISKQMGWFQRHNSLEVRRGKCKPDLDRAGEGLCEADEVWRDHVRCTSRIHPMQLSYDILGCRLPKEYGCWAIHPPALNYWFHTHILPSQQRLWRVTETITCAQTYARLSRLASSSGAE